MRGKFFHNKILAERTAQRFENLGLCVHREFWIPAGTAANRTLGFVDLWIPEIRLVAEIEISPDRVANDLEKALALQARRLWIIVPTAAIREAVRRKLSRSARLDHDDVPDIKVMTLGSALQWLKNKSQFGHSVNGFRDNKTTMAYGTNPHPQNR